MITARNRGPFVFELSNHTNTWRQTLNSNDTTIMPFQFQSNEVRVVTDDHGEPWFVAFDICSALGITDVSDAVRRIPEAHRDQTPIRSGHQRRNMLTVDEPGLYRLILRSDKPAAEPFMEWVTANVLPSIRKTGRYDHNRTVSAVLDIDTKVVSI